MNLQLPIFYDFLDKGIIPTLVGLLVIASAIFVPLSIYLIIKSLGFWILLIPLILLILWSIGCVFMSLVDEEAKVTCDYCNKSFKTVFSLWYHKKRSLPCLVARVK